MQDRFFPALATPARRVVVALLTVLGSTLVFACAEDDGASGSLDGLTVTGVVKEFQPGVERQMYETLRGVKVCVHEHDQVPCDLTDGSGVYELRGVPRNSELLLSFEKKDYGRGLRMLATKLADYDVLAETVLGKIELGVEQAKALGIDLNKLQGGAVQFFAAKPGDGVLQSGPFGGYTARLETLEGEPASCTGDDGLEPCKALYIDEDGEANPDLTKASRLGVGAFGNVPPGEYLLRIEHPDFVCNQALPESGFRASEQGAVRVKAIEGWLTLQTGLFCEPPE